ncbi:molybdopterin molybdotransferase MoeA [Pseudonocardia sp. GCM10023141]|uniref:molybdopterin molybdotransferase MoeA n=1 Tax=Pseudonocardia sp. GCM10023141 TaxID=3252653 RepID=UPI0036074F6B
MALSVAAAAAAWRAARAAAGCADLVDGERVPITAAAGRVTAAAVHAAISVPAVACAAMDGIAVTAACTASRVVGADRFTVVDTGDPLPPGADAVVVREHLRRRPDGSVHLREPARAGQHVRQVGESVRAGDRLAAAGRVLRPADLAAAAAGGVSAVDVRRRPVVTIIPTGDEVRPIGAALAPGELHDTNSLLLVAMLQEFGCDVVVTAIQPDDPGMIEDAVRAAAADLVLVLAGSSAGRDDHTSHVLRAVGTVVVQGVAVRPGHPVLLGIRHGDPAVPVIGVPGYPISAAVAVDLFAIPLLAEMQHREVSRRPPVTARLRTDVPSRPGVEEYVLVTLHDDGSAEPLGRGAGAHTALAQADAAFHLDAGCAGYEAGDVVIAHLLDGPGWAAGSSTRCRHNEHLTAV